MHTLKVTLKQHTPLIHFQHDQEGATLRASEVKPKLDKFILTKLGNGDYQQGINTAKENKWLVGKGEHPALDYKMRITDLDNRSISEREGEVVIIPPNKEKTMISKNIKLNIIASHEDLINNIKQHLEDFFIYNSFGKRNNKGFGNFYVYDEKNPITWEKLQQKLPVGTFIYENFTNRQIGNKLFNNEYKFISEAQRKLKSGINFKNRKGHITYIKSKLFVYSIRKQMRWEKRWIKKQIKYLVDHGNLPSHLFSRRMPNDYCNNLDINTDNGYCSYNNWDDNGIFKDNYFFIRILLGLAEHWEFLTEDRKLKYKVIPENNDIERLKSPLIFKVFDKHIYLLIDKLPQNLSEYPFRFKVQKKIKNKDQKWKDDGEPIYFQDENKQELTLYPPNINKNYNLNDFISNSIQSMGFKRIEHEK